jgi:hypothetical protein
LVKDGTLFSRVVVILHCFWLQSEARSVFQHRPLSSWQNRASYLPVGDGLYITITNVCIRT